MRHSHEVTTVASDFATRREQTGISLTAITFAMGALVLLVACLDFSKPILIGNLIAWPLAFRSAALFKSFYVTEPPFTIMPYVGSLVFGLAVPWVAVFRKAWGAAHLPPAVVLRHE